MITILILEAVITLWLFMGDTTILSGKTSEQTARNKQIQSYLRELNNDRL